MRDDGSVHGLLQGQGAPVDLVEGRELVELEVHVVGIQRAVEQDLVREAARRLVLFK